jgi:C_GCAxxG_C_C family probable redox protein
MNKTISKSKMAVAVMKERKMDCSQAVLTTFCEELRLDYTLALKIAAGFGGGMGLTGRTCGAVTGAYMVLGLAQEISPEKPRASSKKTFALMKKFNKEFMNKHGSLLCKELIGYDFSTKQGPAKANLKEVFATLCPSFVGTSVKILESLLKTIK